jgi:hypothetical protein
MRINRDGFGEFLYIQWTIGGYQPRKCADDMFAVMVSNAIQ